MLTKEQAISLTEILAVGSVTAAGFIIGGTIGASVMAGIGINLATNIVHGGTSKLKEHWLTNTNGILNHDIQHALLRGYCKALSHLQEDYIHLQDKLQENQKEPPRAIRTFFEELSERADENFLPSIEKAIKQKEVKEYLYNNTETATNLLWDRISADKQLHTYNQHFKSYLRERLLSEVQFCFAEELKTDSRECNKAWRAFQRMLLEGIQTDVTAVRASQDIIQRDLQLLHTVKQQLDQLQTSVDHRGPDEPFQQSLEITIEKLRGELTESLQRLENQIGKVNETTLRTEVKLDAIALRTDAVATDVKTLLGTSHQVEAAEIVTSFRSELLVNLGWLDNLLESRNYLRDKTWLALKNKGYIVYLPPPIPVTAISVYEKLYQVNEGLRVLQEGGKHFNREQIEGNIESLRTEGLYLQELLDRRYRAGLCLPESSEVHTEVIAALRLELQINQTWLKNILVSRIYLRDDAWVALTDKGCISLLPAPIPFKLTSIYNRVFHVNGQIGALRENGEHFNSDKVEEIMAALGDAINELIGLLDINYPELGKNLKESEA